MPADTALSSAPGTEDVPVLAAVVGVCPVGFDRDGAAAAVDLVGPVASLRRRPPEAIAGHALGAPVGVQGPPVRLTDAGGHGDLRRRRDLQDRTVFRHARRVARALLPSVGGRAGDEKNCDETEYDGCQLPHGLTLLLLS